MKAIAMGHACVDITPRIQQSPGTEPGILYPVGPLKFTLGGSAINTGRKLHELGANVRLAVASGRDDLDLVYSRLLKATGIPTQLIKTELSTSYSIVIEHGQHDRTFWQHEGFNAAFDAKLVDLDDEGLELVHAGYPSLVPYWCLNVDSLIDTFSSARKRGITTSLDLAHVGKGSVASAVQWRDWFAKTLPVVDVLSPSWDDITSALKLALDPTPSNLRAVARTLIDMGVGVLQLSAGRAGFLLLTASRERLSKGGKVLAPLAALWADQDLWFDAESIEDPRTTVGAGDSLTAGLLRALGEGLAPLESGRFARDVVGQHLRSGAAR